LTQEELERESNDQEKGPNYILESVEFDNEDGQPRLQVKLGGYGQIMRSCDYLIEEAFIAAGVLKGIDRMTHLRASGRRWQWFLPCRKRVFKKGIEATFLRPKGRAVGIGVAGLVLWKGGDGRTCFIFKKRSASVGTYPDLYHCVPTGMFNGKFQGAGSCPSDLQHHAVRVLMTEFFEELFSRKELESFEEDPNWKRKLKACVENFLNAPDGFYEESKKRRASRGGEKGISKHARKESEREQAPGSRCSPTDGTPDNKDIQLSLIGIIYDLLSMRPEIAMTIRLPGEEYGKHFLLNEEGTVLYQVFGKKEGEQDKDVFLSVPWHYDWVRSGYAVYTKGRRLVGRMADKSTSLSEALGKLDDDDAGLSEGRGASYE